MFGGDAPNILRYRDMGMDGADADLVAHTSVEIAEGTMLFGSVISSASRKDHRVGTSVEIHLAADDADEAHRVFEALAEGETISMPFEKVEWSELFGACVDRYGVRWMVDYEGTVRFGAS